jgi:hypothetical protein
MTLAIGDGMNYSLHLFQLLIRPSNMSTFFRFSSCKFMFVFLRKKLLMYMQLLQVLMMCQ